MPKNNPISHAALTRQIAEHFNIPEPGGVCHGVALMGIVAHASQRGRQFNQLLRRTTAPTSSAQITNKRKYDDDETQPAGRKKLTQLDIDQQALLEAIAINQGDLLTKKHIPNPTRQIDSELNLGLILPTSLEEKGGLNKIDSWLGCFDGIELRTFFNLITEQAIHFRGPFSLLIKNIHHAIALNYEPHKRQWRLIDANQLPSHIINTNDLASRIKSALSEDGPFTILNMDIYSIYNQQQTFFQKLKNTPVFNQLYGINSTKATATSSTKTTLTLMAAELNRHTLLKELLAAGANPNLAKNDGATPLYIAAQNNHTECISLLLASGANPNLAENDGATPLYIAAQNDHSESIRFLLASGANPDLAINYGATPLFIAAQNCHTESVRLLLAGDANPNLARNDGVTPLYFAAYNGHTEIVRLLLASGADIQQAWQGKTPLMIAKIQKHDAIVQLLEQAAAKQSKSCAFHFFFNSPYQAEDIDNDADWLELTLRSW